MFTYEIESYLNLGNYKHMSYSYTLEEQQINPEGADLKLSEDQVAAVQMMKRAIILAKNATSGDDLFGYEKENTEFTTQTPLIGSIPTDIYVNGTVTDHKTITPNHVERYDTTPLYSISEVEINSNSEKNTDSKNSSTYVRLSSCMLVVLMGILFDMR